MIRATTPTHSFRFKASSTDPSPEELYSEILVTYTQYGKIVFEKHKSDFNWADPITERGITYYVGYIQLTQEETNLFKPSGEVAIQVRAKIDGTSSEEDQVMASPIMTMNVYDVLNDEVL